MKFKTGAALLEQCETLQIPISEAMIRREITISGQDREAILERMRRAWQIMRDAVEEGREGHLHSIGGLIGGEGKKLLDHITVRSLMRKAAAYAMSVLEVNASMGLIVAAPTAGSSGVIPGVFMSVQEKEGFTDEQMMLALFNAGAVGYLIMQNATVAGAEGGCQAEIGSAAAMAASAVVELMGGTPEQCLAAASDVLSCMLGLVCDPVAGLVEIPCQKRNATAACNALICAEMALAGIETPIPFDEMVTATYRVGRSIPYELRETALGGVAATPSACALCDQILCARKENA
ncbi:MAG: L-serine ammonia-lyase, iron-sulfur-dependent, subunit alpha [Clostridiales bacterium]|nr:L-serine ammonia-lyase, iron-sulfur-dependent, subunit alpha [Clostridiales bacterium]